MKEDLREDIVEGFYSLYILFFFIVLGFLIKN